MYGGVQFMNSGKKKLYKAKKIWVAGAVLATSGVILGIQIVDNIFLQTRELPLRLKINLVAFPNFKLGMREHITIIFPIT